MFIINNWASFPSGKDKIWWNIKNSYTFMTMIACKFFLCILCRYYTLQLVKIIIVGKWFDFLKKRPRPNFKVFNNKFRFQWRDQKSSYQLGLILRPFYDLLSLVLSYTCVKGLTVTNIIKKINLKPTWSKLEAETCFQRLSVNFYLAFYLFINSLNW